MNSKTGSRAASMPGLGLVAILCLVPMPGLAERPDSAAESVVVSAPYARAVPPGQPNSAVFMRIDNPGDRDWALIGASSPAAGVVELHTHRMEQDVLMMRRIDRIDLPAGAAVSLQPGGLHVMLIGLKRQLKPGEDLDLRLRFDDGSELQLTAPVRAIAPAGHPRDGRGDPLDQSRNRH